MIIQRYKDYTIEVKTLVTYKLIRPDERVKDCLLPFTSVEEALEHAVEAVNLDIETDEYNALTKGK